MVTPKETFRLRDGFQADFNRAVFVIMVLSSLAFYVMAFRVPVVRILTLSNRERHP